MEKFLSLFRGPKKRTFYPDVALNQPFANEGKDFISNRISSTKYTWYNFIFKNLFEQFRRITNFYFLIIAIISLIPSISPFSPVTTWGPLIFVLAVSAIKDAIEDIGRWRSDRTVNNRMYEVLRDGHFVKIASKDVVVGDIFCLNRDEESPADAVILATSDPDGIAYVDTANLDGETNLKAYKARPETKDLTRKQIKRFQAVVSATINHPNLYKFQGNITIETPKELTKPESNPDEEESAVEMAEWKPPTPTSDKLFLDEKHLMLRGARLRNTKECYCGVVYTGFETKVQLNANSPPSKFAMTDQIINRVVLTIFSFKITACTGCAIANFLFERTNAPLGVSTYLSQNGSPTWRGFLTFWSYFALFSYFIPISLIVTLEIAKLVQAVFMMWDVQMMNEEENSGMTVKNSNLNDELARVGYIFCDKTGTLTENRMVFDKASVGGVAYRQARHKELYRIIRPRKLTSSQSQMGTSQLHAQHSPDPTVEMGPGQKISSGENTHNQANGTGTSNISNKNDPNSKPELSKMVSSSSIIAKTPRTIDQVLEFVLLLALANTAQVEYYNPEEEAKIKANKKLKKKKKKKLGGLADESIETEEELIAKRTSIRYQAQSPDEICLCNFAKDNGVTLKARRNTDVIVDILGKEKIYDILQVMEFTSDRRRMSIIVRDRENKKIILYSKGADSIMMARLSKNEDNDLIEATQQHVDEYSLEGLRTLIAAKKEISETEYYKFAKEFNAALALTIGRDEEVERLSDLIERDLILVGATAIEDKLQDGVPEAIAYFLAGGIKVWIITGDKQDTAINIAKSCNLIQSGVTVVKVNAKTDDECTDALQEALKVAESDPRVALVIDGPSLPLAFNQGSMLLAVAVKCEAVVVCRATPLQKAQVVRMIKRGTDELTLSVGDGANDVSMLQEAHIGVGIFGKEGSQAARSGDYAIYMYKHLKRLVCIHGRYNYLRSAALIQFCYYKNLAMFLVQLWYSFFNGFSAQPLYEAFTMAVYNVLITVAPPFFIGIFERDLRERMLEKYPQAHRQVRAGEGGFTYKNFLGWIFGAIYHSLVIFGLPYFCFQPSITDYEGRSTGFWVYGMTTFAGGFFTVILKIALYSQWWIWPVHLGIWGSMVFYLLLVWVLSSMPSYFAYIYELFYQTFSDAVSIFIIILVPVVALLPDFCFYYIRRNYKPRDHHILQELDFAEEHERKRALKQMDTEAKAHLESMHVKPPDLRTIERTAFVDDLESDRRHAEVKAMEHEQMAARRAAEEAAEDSDYEGEPLQPLSAHSADSPMQDSSMEDDEVPKKAFKRSQLENV